MYNNSHKKQHRPWAIKTRSNKCYYGTTAALEPFGESWPSRPDPYSASEIRNLDRFIVTSVQHFLLSLNYDIRFISLAIPDVDNISAVLTFLDLKGYDNRVVSLAVSGFTGESSEVFCSLLLLYASRQAWSSLNISLASLYKRTTRKYRNLWWFRWTLILFSCRSITVLPNCTVVSEKEMSEH